MVLILQSIIDIMNLINFSEEDLYEKNSQCIGCACFIMRFLFCRAYGVNGCADNVGIYLIEDFEGYGDEIPSVSTLEGFWSWCYHSQGWPAADAYIELGELCIYSNGSDAFFFDSVKGGAPKEEMANAEYIGFHVTSNLDKEMQICFFGGGDANLKDEGEANFQMIKDNLNPDEVQSYSAYIVTDDGEVMATRNNPDRVTLPANFKGYVIYDITDYRNSWASEGEDNTMTFPRPALRLSACISMPTTLTLSTISLLTTSLSAARELPTSPAISPPLLIMFSLMPACSME